MFQTVLLLVMFTAQREALLAAAYLMFVVAWKKVKTGEGRPGLNTPHARTMVKTLKLAIYLFL
jgi:hypothetical protein